MLLDHVITRPVSVLPAESLVTTDSCWLAPTRTLAEAGLTATEATGTFATVMVALPVFPSLIAVSVADPEALPVTRPLALTVATVALVLDHVTVRPLSVLPAESLVTAASWRVAPTKMLAAAGLTLTEATGTLATVIVAVAVFPSLVAETVVEPAAPAVTRPDDETAATPPFELDQLTARPTKTLPAESRVLAASCVV